MKHQAYWINSRTNAIIPVDETHIALVNANPTKFGLTRKEIEKIHKKYKEPLGQEGRAREEIMLNLILQDGWIRARWVPRAYTWTMELAQLNSRTKEAIWQFFSLLTGQKVGVEKPIDNIKPTSDVRIVELKDKDDPKLTSSSMKDILAFKGVFESLKIMQDITPQFRYLLIEQYTYIPHAKLQENWIVR